MTSRVFKLLAFLAISLLLCAMVIGGTTAGQDFLIARAIQDQMVNNRTDLYDEDAMRVLICGSSSPLPAPKRAKACVAVFAAGRMWIVDVGPGSSANLSLWRIPLERIGAVLLTHFHSDHIGELGEVNFQTWTSGRSAPMDVYGGTGVERVVAGFAQAYELDTSYRIAHHGAETMNPALAHMRPHTISPTTPGTPTVIVDQDDLRISAFLVDHAPIEPALAYRFDWKGRSVIVSGDTVATEEMVQQANGVDLLVHEAQAQHIVKMLHDTATEADLPLIAKITADITDYHTSPTEVAEIANKAEVGLALLYHLTPAPRNLLMKRIFLRGVSDIRPDGIELAEDGTLVTLPIGSEAIEVSRIK
ncbi:MAG: ribonuclease Z [Hyphomicrobiaceae bacterium]|jgi:ribonuclease Z